MDFVVIRHAIQLICQLARCNNHALVAETLLVVRLLALVTQIPVTPRPAEKKRIVAKCKDSGGTKAGKRELRTRAKRVYVVLDTPGSAQMKPRVSRSEGVGRSKKSPRPFESPCTVKCSSYAMKLSCSLRLQEEQTRLFMRRQNYHST